MASCSLEMFFQDGEKEFTLPWTNRMRKDVNHKIIIENTTWCSEMSWMVACIWITYFGSNNHNTCELVSWQNDHCHTQTMYSLSSLRFVRTFFPFQLHVCTNRHTFIKDNRTRKCIRCIEAHIGVNSFVTPPNSTHLSIFSLRLSTNSIHKRQTDINETAAK